MRIGVGLAAFTLGALAVWHFARSGAPTAPQVEPLLRGYLESTSHCDGTIDIQIDNVSIGSYVSQMGGWPVYADHVEACHSKVGGLDNSSLTMTYDGSHDTEKKVVRRRTIAANSEDLDQIIVLPAGAQFTFNALLRLSSVT